MINISGGNTDLEDMTAASEVIYDVDPEANIIVGTVVDESEGPRHCDRDWFREWPTVQG